MNIELTTWLWLAYLVPMLIGGATSVYATWEVGQLTLGELLVMLAQTLIPVVNFVCVLWLLFRIASEFKNVVIWRRK